MSYASGRGGTAHHKIHTLTGWGVIIGLPFAVGTAIAAIGERTDGFLAWLSNPLGALGLLAFATAAAWYCKLEMDEVIMDYVDGGTRKTLLLTNKLVALLVWLALAFACISLAFL